MYPVLAIGQTITTFAGDGVAGIAGDGGSATTAKIDNPHFCTFDKFGNFYFSQYAAHTIRRINSSGIITTVAISHVAIL